MRAGSVAPVVALCLWTCKEQAPGTGTGIGSAPSRVRSAVPAHEPAPMVAYVHPRPASPPPLEERVEIMVGSIEEDGRMRDTQELRDGLGTVIAEIRACYARGVERDPKLRGQVRVMFDLDEHGKALDPKPVRPDFRYPDVFPDIRVLGCVTRAMGRFTVAPRPRRSTIVILLYLHPHQSVRR